MYRLTIRYGFLNYQIVTKQTVKGLHQAVLLGLDAIQAGYMAIIEPVRSECQHTLWSGVTQDSWCCACIKTRAEIERVERRAA